MGNLEAGTTLMRAFVEHCHEKHLYSWPATWRTRGRGSPPLSNGQSLHRLADMDEGNFQAFSRQREVLKDKTCQPAAGAPLGR